MTSRALGWALVAAQMLAFAVLAREATRARGRAHPTRGAGWLIAGAGAAVVAAGSRRLGRMLRAHPEPPEGAVLRTDGAYRFVRHPIYSGLLLLGGGLALASRSARAAGALGTLVAALLAKARLEEALLVQRFPAYVAYARRTPRFVPRIAAPRDWEHENRT